MIAALAALLTRTAGTEVGVTAVAALSGGASSETFSVDAVRGGRPWPLIFQRSSGDAPPGEPPMPTKAAQAELQRIAVRHGLPVAEVVAVARADDALGDGFVMARVPGEALAPRWLKSPDYAGARAALTGQCAQALATLHAVPLGEVASLRLPGGSPRDQCDRFRTLYLSFDVAVPVFDLAFGWLDERLPASLPTALLHGDFRSGNLIIHAGGLAAVLDWELAHLGHPAEDLAWLCVNAWRFGHWQRPVGGFGERDALYAAYAAAGGAAIGPETAHVFEVYGTLRWGVMCLAMAHDHLSGRVRSLERAAIGRRVTEVEADLLHLLKHGTI